MCTPRPMGLDEPCQTELFGSKQIQRVLKTWQAFASVNNCIPTSPLHIGLPNQHVQHASKMPRHVMQHIRAFTRGSCGGGELLRVKGLGFRV